MTAVENCGKEKNVFKSNKVFSPLLLNVKPIIFFMRKQILSAAVAAAFSMVIFSCADSTTTTTEKKDSANNMSSTTDNASKMEEEGVMVGGSKMVASKNIVDNATGSADHTTLVTAVKAADLVTTLSSAGPFTVFAPTNDAFNKLPAGTVDNLLKPEMKDDLTKVLTYHVVPGYMMAADLKDGQELTTVQGEKLSVWMKDGKWMVKDANGATANIIIADVKSSNGVTYVIDAVLMPKK